jgi:hypothetical protein
MKASLKEQPEWGYARDSASTKPKTDGYGSRWTPPDMTAGATYNQVSKPAPRYGNPQQNASADAAEHFDGQDACRMKTCWHERHVQRRLPRGKAVASLALGILSLIFAPLGIVPLVVAPFITGAFAVILGLVSVSRCKRAQESGMAMAVSGMILGVISVAGWLALLYEYYCRTGHLTR